MFPWSSPPAVTGMPVRVEVWPVLRPAPIDQTQILVMSDPFTRQRTMHVSVAFGYFAWRARHGIFGPFRVQFDDS